MIDSISPDINYETLKNKRVLWVDDKPFNNSQHIDIFTSLGVICELANTTEDAKKLLNVSQHFDLIISNMGRPPKEGEPDNPEEGIVFLQFLKKEKNATPVIIYTKPETQKSCGDSALSNGAAAVTQGYASLLKKVLNILRNNVYLGK